MLQHHMHAQVAEQHFRPRRDSKSIWRSWWTSGNRIADHKLLNYFRTWSTTFELTHIVQIPGRAVIVTQL